MNVWLKIFLELSLGGAVLILVLSAVSRLFGRYLGRGWQYYIWILAVVRLLLPVPAPTGVLFPNAQQRSARMSALPGESGEPAEGKKAEEGRAEANKAVGQIDTGTIYKTAGAVVLPPVNGEADDMADGKADSAALLPSLFLLWAAVSLGMMSKKYRDYRRTAKLLCESRIETDRFSGAFEQARRACGLDKSPRLLVSSAVLSPLMIGVVKPMIVMPAEFLPSQAYYVFLHEMTHIRRKDALYKWAVEITVCLHWFNPMVYLMRREMARACELSCDEAVIRQLDREEIRMYGNTLLEALRRHVIPETAAMILPLSENARWTKERLTSILKFKKKSRTAVYGAASLTAVLACVAVLCGFAPLPGENSTAKLPAYSDSGISEGGQNEKQSVLFQAAALPAGTSENVLTKTGNSSSPKSEIPAQGSDVSKDGLSWDSNDMRLRDAQKSSYTRMDWVNGYIVAVGWNVDSSRYDTVRRIGGKTVCYTKNTMVYADDGAVSEAVRQFIENQAQAEAWFRFPPEEMVLLGVAGPFRGTADELAVRFYEEENIPCFSVMIEHAGAAACGNILERAYEEKREEYFAIVCDRPQLAEKRKEIAAKAVKDGEINFFAIISSDLSDLELAQYAQDAYIYDRLDIFYLTLDSLNTEQADAIAKRAYADDRIEYFYALSEKMTKEQRRSIREQAVKDRKIEFSYAAWN